MAELKFEREITALLVIDPYNDFISEGGKFWGHLKTVAEANNCVPNMLRVLNAARAAKLRVFYPLHRRYRPGDYETWKYIGPVQKRSWSHKAFEYGTRVVTTSLAEYVVAVNADVRDVDLLFRTTRDDPTRNQERRGTRNHRNGGRNRQCGLSSDWHASPLVADLY
jgi:hypothetical protein